MIILYILISLLSVGYWLYSGQMAMALAILAGYVITRLILQVTLRPKKEMTMFLFTLFFLIYGTLVLLTHIELIHDPNKDYYVHNDAAHTFYKLITQTVLPCSWRELFHKTIANPLFSHYPLGAFIMALNGKIGMALGVANLRLFMRLHIFMIGASVIAVITNLFEYKNISQYRIITIVTCFGLFSYLYITSAIFTRDTYVCLVYTIAAYICLKEEVRHRLLLFIILFFVARGLRPENGLLMLVYPFAYYYDYLKDRIGILGIITLIIIGIGMLFMLNESFHSNANSLDIYDQKTLNNTGGLFIKFYQLPFPLNTIIMIVYMTLMPLPMFMYCFGKAETWLNLPYILSPYLLFLVFASCIYYCFKAKGRKKQYTIIFLASLFIYSAIIYGSPDVRRAFAAIPGTFMCYGIMSSHIPESTTLQIKRTHWIIIALINLFFAYYKYIR